MSVEIKVISAVVGQIVLTLSEASTAPVILGTLKFQIQIWTKTGGAGVSSV